MNDTLHLQDHLLQQGNFQQRLRLSVLLILVLLLVLVLRYFYLQVIEYELYRTESDRNRIQLQALPPNRGLIFDRGNRLLAENQPGFVLSLVPGKVPNFGQTLEELRELLPVTDRDVEKYELRASRQRPSDTVPLRFRLSEVERALLAVNRYRWPGVFVEAQLVRHYPQAQMFSHALGYVSRISEQDEARIDESNYRGIYHIGKIGLERQYEELLRGTAGSRSVESSARGEVLRELDRNPPQPGAELTLHLDSRLQQVAYEALGDRRGAVVALDPFSGGVLALVSTPGFDTNLFVNGVSNTVYQALRESPELPLYNRAVQGQYPPGSTVKPVFALAGLHHGAITPTSTINDPGWYVLPGQKRRYRDWTLRVRGGGHGPQVDLFQAIAESCDVYFYDLAHKLGIDRIHDFSRPFGFGELTGIDTTYELGGVMPSRQWKETTRGQPWFPGETLNVGIGQGQMLATPLQLAVVTATIATRGLRYPPRLLHKVNGEAIAPPTPQRIAVKPADWDLIHEAMKAVLHSPQGTAYRSGLEAGYVMAGKSGTAQVVGIAQDQRYDAEAISERHRDHGWFIAFAPFDKPRIAVSVIVENGGGGSSVAAPVARQVMDRYLLPDRVSG